MILLTSKQQDEVVVLIGIGLVGGVILERLLKLGYQISAITKVSWRDPDFFSKQFQFWFSKYLPFHVRKLDLIWSAGKTGFGSSEQDCVAEIAHFQAFILSAKSIESKYQVPFFVHYLSSAGALFEGQLRVDDFTVPRPMRPYGFAKLFQESLLTSTFPKGYVVYRPSSIYGPSKNGTRVGLISRLLTCIYSFTEISIFGGMNTLRDFVWVYDVAEFISAQVSTKAAIGGRLYHLVSGKPSSIFEVSQVVAKVSGKRMLFRVEKYDDDLSMSFSSCISCCRTTNLEYGIRSTFLRQF